MMNNIPQKPESLVKIKFFHFLDSIIKPILIFWNKLILFLVVVIVSWIYSLWNHLYLYLYEHRKYLSKVYLKCLSLIEAVILIIFCVRFFYFKIYEPSLLWWMSGLAATSIGIFLILYLYYIFIGRANLFQQYILDTDKYVEECMPSIVKIYGAPRVGKDTTATSMTSILCRRNRRVIPKIMVRIRKIGYVFDYVLVNRMCNAYAEKFFSSSKKVRETNFIWLCQQDFTKAFLKEKYLKEIDYQDFIEDYKRSLKNKVTYQSIWLYSDGISKHHLLDYLKEYMFLYVRLYILKQFSLINQPYIEDPETGLMGKRYSVLYEASSSAEPVTKTEKELTDMKVDIRRLKDVVINYDSSGKPVFEFKEKIMSPIIDWTVINLTEFDTWMRNIDKDVKELIETYNLRDSKAFYGHYYNNLNIIQVCHEASRTQAQLRELDAFYINVLQRVEFLGASKRNAILSIIQKATNYFTEKGNLKLDDANNSIIYRSQKKMDYYQRLYDASGNTMYLDKIAKLEAKELKTSNYFTDLMSKWNQKLMSKIEQNSRKHGIIKITATISDQANAPNLKPITMKELVKRDTPLFHEAYKVDFYFRMTDSMGRYNHQYMSPVLENRAAKSLINFGNIMAWEYRMELTKQAMLEMGFPAGKKMYDITPEEDFIFRYVSYM